MSHDLIVQCVSAGRLDTDAGSYEIRENRITVEDESTAADLARSHKRLERATADDAADDSDDAADSQVADPPIDPGEYTNDELAAHLDETDYSDDELRAIADAESAGQDRDGAHEAIDNAQNDE